MTAIERADAIVQDILVNHLPRIREGLERGYVDENQILIIYDHAVRARILREHAGVQPEKSMASSLAHVFNERQDAIRVAQGKKTYDDHEDALSRIEIELDAQGEEFEAHVPQRKVYNYKLNKTPRTTFDRTMTGADLRALLPDDKATHGIFQEATGNDPDIQVEDSDSVEVEDKEFYSVPPATFGEPMPLHVKEVKGKFVGKSKSARDEANFHQAHVEKLECVCGGLIHDDPQFTGDVFLECGSCGRTFISEFDLAEARKTEVKKGRKFVDATYFSAGTLLGGTDPVLMEIEISLNGRKATVKSDNGKFVLSYERIVRMALNQRRDPLAFVTSPDADLPNWTCIYHHRVPSGELPGERSGSLHRGQSVPCTVGMSISCMNTSNA